MATIAQSTNSTFKNKFVVALRNIFARFVKAHELQASVLPGSEHDRAIASSQLHRMADRLETSQPNLAAELRFIASRG